MGARGTSPGARCVGRRNAHSVSAIQIPDREVRERLSGLADLPMLPEEAPVGTLDLLFDALGSDDPHLREEIAARTLGRWIVVQHVLPSEPMRLLHQRACGQAGALQHLGESGTTSVFRRSFSILLLAFIHAADNRTEFLTDDEWASSAHTLVSYGQGEQDVRAKVPHLGWAHAIAHAADLADELAKSPRCSHGVAAQILSALGDLVARAREPFRGEEEDRVAVAIAALLENRLITWDDLTRAMGSAPASLDEARRINWKGIVRSLYFRLDGGEVRERAAALQAELTIV